MSGAIQHPLADLLLCDTFERLRKIGLIIFFFVEHPPKVII